jgi:hypothetical protein
MSCPVQRHLSDEERIMAGRTSELRINATAVEDVCVLTLDGVLDGITYRPLRDSIVKAALDEPRGVIADVTKLTVREDPAWAVFTSARWQVADWPDIPIGLVCAHDQGRNSLHRTGITRYVPVYPTLPSALAELSADGVRRYRRRRRASLPAERTSIRLCRALVEQWLTAWSRTDFIHAASTVVTELVENALDHTDSDFSLRMETDGSIVSIAVQHVGVTNPTRRKSSNDNVTGLALVAASCRSWGSYATANGYTVYGVIGPENRF